LELIRRKDNRTGLVISISLHVGLLLAIMLSKGCGEIQNPPQFTLEEVVVLDFSESGGGNPGSSAPKKTPPIEEEPAPKEVTQEESPVSTPTSNANKPKPTSESSPESETKQEEPKNDFSNLFGKGSGDSESGNGEGEGSGIGTGKGPNTGGGMGTGKGRQVLGNPELDNPKNWVGFVMVQFIIDEEGSVISTKVLYPHSKTTVTLTNSDQRFIEADCKKKFSFTPTSTGLTKDRLVKRIQYIKK
jgi:hypothetical protein